MLKNKAYLDTTIVADALLKIGSDSEAAKNALDRYPITQLPVYAIKEFKAGPLAYVSYLHRKLLEGGSYAGTFLALAGIVKHQNRVATCLRLLSDLHSKIVSSPQHAALKGKYGSLAEVDKIIFDSLVLESKTLVLKAWLRCSSLTTDIVNDLPCYPREAPKVRRNGSYNMSPTTCKTVDCCMAAHLRSRKLELTKLVTTIKKLPAKRENGPRSEVLHSLAVRANLQIEEQRLHAIR